MNMQGDRHMMTVRRHQAHGWTVSTFIHLCGMGGALILMAELERPALPQPLRFDITLVQRTSSPAMSEPASADMPSPAPARTPSPASVPERPVERPVKAKRVVAGAQEISRVTRDIVTAPTPVVAQPREEKPVSRMPSVHETGRPMTQSAQSSRMIEERRTVTHSPAAVQESIVEPMTSIPVSQAAPEPTEPVETDRTVVSNKTVERDRTVEQSPVIERTAVVTSESSQDVQIAPAVEHRVMTQRAVRTLPQTQADYGWLAESLWKRIEQLKRYPSLARTRRWEGKVILEAVIRDDGTIMELRIEESSGHAILDQDALAVVKKASPLQLRHSLGQPQITILVPISYNLDS